MRKIESVITWSRLNPVIVVIVAGLITRIPITDFVTQSRAFLMFASIITFFFAFVTWFSAFLWALGMRTVDFTLLLTRWTILAT